MHRANCMRVLQHTTELIGVESVVIDLCDLPLDLENELGFRIWIDRRNSPFRVGD